jgi:hypothetical protein
MSEFSRQIGKGNASIASGEVLHKELVTPVGGLCRLLARVKILAGCHQNSKNHTNLHINMLKIMLSRQTVGNCKPRRDLGIAVTAVRIRLHAHEADDPAGTQLGERPQRPVLDLAETPQALPRPLVDDLLQGKPGAQRPLAERGVEPGNRPAELMSSAGSRPPPGGLEP